jgi:hypothetical protein
MVFSAPEMTTVSNPKRNPASADVSDQKNMRPFIEDRALGDEQGVSQRDRSLLIAQSADSILKSR